MNRDTNVGKNSATNYAKNSAKNSADSATVDVTAWEVAAKRKWSRPSVTIIDLKRTLFFGGSVDDGGLPSSGV